MSLVVTPLNQTLVFILWVTGYNSQSSSTIHSGISTKSVTYKMT